MKDRQLPPGWRMTELPPHKVEEHLEQVWKVAEELRKIPRIKKEAPKPPENATPEELEAFYFAQQPKSTQDAILRQKERRPEEDAEWLLRPLPENVLANPDAKSLDELTAKRTIDPEDALREKALKTGRNQLGQSTKGSVEGEKRDRGIHAFTYSKPANLTDDEIWRIKSLNEIDAIVAAEPENKPQAKKKSLWEKFWSLPIWGTEEFWGMRKGGDE